MKVNKEFILDEEDIRSAIYDYLSCDLDDVEKATIDFKIIANDEDDRGVQIEAICKETA